MALYRSEEWNRQHGRRHKTPAHLLRQLLAVLAHWFPQRRFLLTADGNYAGHELAARAAPRDIVLLHDNHAGVLTVLDRALPGLRERGFDLGRGAGLLAAAHSRGGETCPASPMRSAS